MNYLKDLFIDEAKKALLNKENGSGGVKINNQDKTITANGVYSADEGFTGLGNVSVNVPVNVDGGEMLDAIVDGNITEIISNAKRVRSKAFAECKLLTSVNLPKATYIGTYAFENCTSLKNISVSVGTISSYAFSGCTSLETVDLPVTSNIQNSAFSGCTSIKNVNVPKVTMIASYGFAGCIALKSVALPRITTIGSCAFFNCTALEFLDFTGVSSVPSLDNTNAFTGVPTTCEFRVPAALADEWKAQSRWSTYASQIVGV